MNAISDVSVVKAYLQVKRYLYRCNYFNEIEWQYRTSLSNVNEKIFLEEYAWVVLNTGMKEKIVRKIFPNIASSFFGWLSAEKIVKHHLECQNKALTYFNNKKKIEAIIDTAYLINEKTFTDFFENIIENGINGLKRLPYIGPATSYHLAKNIGFSVSKPDRHLSKLADKLNYESVKDMCDIICFYTDEPISVIDLVLWRYSTIKSDFYDICKSIQHEASCD
jgi:hypothetical protein